MNRPFIWISLAYISGILIAKFLSIPYFYAWMGVFSFLLLAVLCLLQRQPRTICPASTDENNPRLKHKMGAIIDQSFLSLLSGKQRNDYEQGKVRKGGKIIMV